MPALVYNPKHVSDSNFDAIVVGSGPGGLCTAALLAQNGKKVLVLEQHYVAGGFSHTFKRKHFEWDVGVHYVGEVHRPKHFLRQLFDCITDAKLKWAPMEKTYDRIVIGSAVFDFDANDFLGSMLRYFPKEEKALREYIRLVYEASGAARSFYVEKTLPNWVSPVSSQFLGRKFLNFAKQTTYEVLSKLTSDPMLIGVLTGQWGDYGLPPHESSFAMHAMVAKHYFHGGAYPVGGARAIADSIMPTIEQAGGKIVIKAAVEKILVKNNQAVGVRIQDGTEVFAPIVISNAGWLNTVEHLLETPEAEKLTKKKAMTHLRPSSGHFGVYLAVAGSKEELKLHQTNYWIYPTPDHDLNLRVYRQNPKAALPVTYISFPSVKDPQWQQEKPNFNTVQVVGFTPYEWFAKWKDLAWKRRGEEYEALKASIADRLKERFYDFVPQVRGKILHEEVSSPLSTEFFSAYRNGAMYGLDHNPERFTDRRLRARTSISGLYLTGQDIVSVGVGGALMSGLVTASAILGKNLIPQVLKSPGVSKVAA